MKQDGNNAGAVKLWETVWDVAYTLAVSERQQPNENARQDTCRAFIA